MQQKIDIMKNCMQIISCIVIILLFKKWHKDVAPSTFIFCILISVMCQKPFFFFYFKYFILKCISLKILLNSQWRDAHEWMNAWRRRNDMIFGDMTTWCIQSLFWMNKKRKFFFCSSVSIYNLSMSTSVQLNGKTIVQ